VVRVSWWIWAIVAWLLISVPFAIFTAKFIAAGRERPVGARPGTDAEPLIDLPAIEAEESAAAGGADGRAHRPKRPLRAH
jgi:hypothetical protein